MPIVNNIGIPVSEFLRSKISTKLDNLFEDKK